MKILVSQKELKDWLGVSYPTIRHWIEQGMPHLRTGPTSYAFEWQKVKRWLEARGPIKADWVKAVEAKNRGDLEGA